MKEILPGILTIKYFPQNNLAKTANVRKSFQNSKG